jgi:hypothetical protein
MADAMRMALSELLVKAATDPDTDVLREGLRVLAEALMELELDSHLGAGRYERTGERSGDRNGTRERRWDTRVGTLEVAVPRVRDGSFFPVLLEPRKRAERVLVAVVQEAYVLGVSTRRVDDLVKALGLEGISKSQVSRGTLRVLRRPRCRGRTLPHAATGRGLPVSVAGCHLSQGPRWGAGGEQRRGGGGRGDRRRTARGPRLRRGAERGRGVLGNVLTRTDRTGPQRDRTGGQRCP